MSYMSRWKSWLHPRSRAGRFAEKLQSEAEVGLATPTGPRPLDANGRSSVHALIFDELGITNDLYDVDAAADEIYQLNTDPLGSTFLERKPEYSSLQAFDTGLKRFRRDS